MLVCRNGRSDSLTLEGRLAGGRRVLVTVEEGVIARIEPGGSSDAVLAPAFVDPHVHLRTPGREDEETIASGTEAAAAGGYCAILAMPNTDPAVDSAPVLRGLLETARREAVVPVGFMAAISRSLGGEELTEMGELADAGAAAFTDDGRPVVSAGLLQRALQYGSVTGRPLALHCEEPTLSRDGHVHEGAVSAELGLAGYPSVGESTMVERDLGLAAYEGRPVHLMHLSARESVEALARARDAGVAATGEVTPHHLVLTDDAVRSLDPNTKMNPPLRSENDRQALLDGLRDGTIGCVATDHAPHSREEKDVPFEAAPFGVTGLETAFASLYTHLVLPGLISLETLLERMSAGPARAFGLPEPTTRGRGAREPRPARPRRGVDGDRGGLPLALGQLLAARRAPARRRREDGRRRTGGARRVMTAVGIPAELEPYLGRLVDVLSQTVPVDAVYLLGSAALGAYEHGRSDVDVVAVTSRSLSMDERRALAAAAAAIPVPARKLELVVYPRGSTRWELNLNTAEGDAAEHVGLDPDAEPSFWFVLDRAIAEQHALPLRGAALGRALRAGGP